MHEVWSALGQAQGELLALLHLGAAYWTYRCIRRQDDDDRSNTRASRKRKQQSPRRRRGNKRH